jgi:hypothetical protein
LLYFDAVPPEKGSGSGSAFDWSPFFAAAGLEAALLEPAESEWNPLLSTDRREAWIGRYADQPDLPIRVETGSFDGMPVYFSIVAPWTTPARMEQTQQTQVRAAGIIVLSAIALLLLGAILMARANLKRGRGDRRGAFVMAGYLFFVLLAQWVLEVHHVKSFVELIMFADALQTGLFVGAIVWVIYVALEPFARRQWPHALISWSRLLTGRIRDPLIGRDLLIGSLSGVCVAVLIVVGLSIPSWLGQPGPPPINSLGTLGSLKDVAANLLRTQPGAMIVPIAIFFVIFGLRLVLRRQWLAIGAAFVLMTVVQGLQLQASSLPVWITACAVWALLIFVIVRFGVLAALISFVYGNMLLSLPLTTDASAWYANRGWFGLTLLAAVTGFGVYASLAGRPLLATTLLQDA